MRTSSQGERYCTALEAVEAFFEQEAERNEITRLASGYQGLPF